MVAIEVTHNHRKMLNVESHGKNPAVIWRFIDISYAQVIYFYLDDKDVVVFS